MFGTKVDITQIRTSSKDALKRSLMQMYQGDLKTMREMYDFYMQDMSDLPDFDEVKPSAFDQVKNTAVDLFSWVDKNQDKVANAIAFVQNMRNGAPVHASATVVKPPEIPY